MKRARLAILTCAAALAATPYGQAAVSGAARFPSSAMVGAPDPGSTSGVVPEEGGIEAAVVNAEVKVEEKAEKIADQVESGWKRLRPSWSGSGLSMSGNESALQSKSFLQDVYSRDRKNRMDYEYNTVVAPYEKYAMDPTRQATRIQMIRYMDGQRDMVKWAMKDIGQGQLHEVVGNIQANGGDGLLGGINRFTGHYGRPADPETAPIAKEDLDAMTPEQKAARERRLDALALAHSEAPDDPEVPTKLKPKLNPLKQRGAVMLESGIVNGMIEGGSHEDEKVAVEVNRDFHKFDLYSRVRYGVTDSLLSMNVSKRITKEISVDLASDHWTGDKRSDAGEKDRESARLTYSLGF